MKESNNNEVKMNKYDVNRIDIVLSENKAPKQPIIYYAGDDDFKSKIKNLCNINEEILSMSNVPVDKCVEVVGVSRLLIPENEFYQTDNNNNNGVRLFTVHTSNNIYGVFYRCLNKRTNASMYGICSSLNKKVYSKKYHQIARITIPVQTSSINHHAKSLIYDMIYDTINNSSHKTTIISNHHVVMGNSVIISGLLSNYNNLNQIIENLYDKLQILIKINCSYLVDGTDIPTEKNGIKNLLDKKSSYIYVHVEFKSSLTLPEIIDGSKTKELKTLLNTIYSSID